MQNSGEDSKAILSIKLEGSINSENKLSIWIILKDNVKEKQVWEMPIAPSRTLVGLEKMIVLC